MRWWWARFYWGGSRLRAVLLVTLICGPVVVLLVLVDLLLDGPSAAVWTGSLVLGTVILVSVAWGADQRWPAGWELDPADRMVVLSIVRRGRLLQDPRLAPHVIELAEHERRGLAPEFRGQWALMAASFALNALLVLSYWESRSIAMFQLGIGIWLAFKVLRPARATTARLKIIDQAETAARDLLNTIDKPEGREAMSSGAG